MAIETLNITMLGPSGVGKTSLLASMYREFDKSSASALALTPSNGASARKLGDKLKELLSQTENFEATGGISGTQQEQKFEFGFGLRGKKARLNIVFHDYPGGYLNQEDKEEHLKTRLLESDVIILAIDTPALMEQPNSDGVGSHNERINSTETVSYFLNSIFQDLKDEKLVLLAPIKCESYLKEKANKTKQLIKNVHTEYGSLLRNFAVHEHKLAVVISSVQTMGNVEFSRIDDRKSPPAFIFRRISGDYSPKNIDQPLKYALAFLLSKHLRNRDFWQRTKDFFNIDAEKYKEALEYLTNPQSLKGFEENHEGDNEGFYFVQGKPLFALK